jgi:hypothetical protein
MPLALAELQKLLDVEEKLSIDLEWCRVGDEGAEALAKCVEAGNLTNLDLAWNALTEKGSTCLVNAMSSTGQLSRLNLQGNQVGDMGAGKQAYCPALDRQPLNLRIARPAEYIAQFLHADKSLTSLSVESCDIGPQGFARLCSTLDFNSGLTSLNLSRNNAGSNNPSYLISRALGSNFVLTSLDIGGNGLSEWDLLYIADALNETSVIQKLQIGSTTKKAEDVFDAVFKQRSNSCNPLSAGAPRFSSAPGVLTQRNSIFGDIGFEGEEEDGGAYAEVSSHSPTAGMLAIAKNKRNPRRRRSFGERAIRMVGGGKLSKKITGKKGRSVSAVCADVMLFTSATWMCLSASEILPDDVQSRAQQGAQQLLLRDAASGAVEEGADTAREGLF